MTISLDISLDSISGIFIIGGLALVSILSVLRILWAKQRVGELTLPNGRSYTYLIGDYMRSYGSSGGIFHGVDVSLPKEMPHIYLNSLRGGGRQMQYVIDPSQKIQLEGNFNKDFQVFVPEKYKVLALSVLAPDVMATIQDCATPFDVEIYGSHVRIISSKRVLPRAPLQTSTLLVAAKVMHEIDHRLQSWSKADSLDASNQDLLMYPFRGVRVRGRHIRYQTIWWMLYWLTVGVGLGTFGVYNLLADTGVRWVGVFCIAFFVVMTAVSFYYTSRDMRRARFRSRH